MLREAYIIKIIKRYIFYGALKNEIFTYSLENTLSLNLKSFAAIM